MVWRMSAAGRQGSCPNNRTRSKGSKWTSPHRTSHRRWSSRQVLGFHKKSNQNPPILFELVWCERYYPTFCSGTGRHRQDCYSQIESQCILDPTRQLHWLANWSSRPWSHLIFYHCSSGDSNIFIASILLILDWCVIIWFQIYYLLWEKCKDGLDFIRFDPFLFIIFNVLFLTKNPKTLWVKSELEFFEILILYNVIEQNLSLTFWLDLNRYTPSFLK